MNAALQNTGRSAIKERQEAMAARERKLPHAKITAHLNYGSETTEQRKARHAEATGTSRGLWK